jgi:hypothetical protein
MSQRVWLWLCEVGRNTPDQLAPLLYWRWLRTIRLHYRLAASTAQSSPLSAAIRLHHRCSLHRLSRLDRFEVSHIPDCTLSSDCSLNYHHAFGLLLLSTPHRLLPSTLFAAPPHASATTRPPLQHPCDDTAVDPQGWPLRARLNEGGAMQHRSCDRPARFGRAVSAGVTARGPSVRC